MSAVRWLLVPALLAFATLAPTAGAVPPDDPVFEDPAGDATLLQSVPVPAGAEAWDIVAGWFHDETPDAVTLTIQVVAASGPPPSGEVGATFLTPDGYRIAGYTVVPGAYSGGFLCTADEAGDVRSADGHSCDSIPATFADDQVTVALDRSTLNVTNAGDALVGAWGWSEAQAANGDDWRFDRTEPGRDFVFGTGAATENVSTPGATDDPEVVRSPAPSFVAIGVALAGLTVAVHRRRV